jgi:hypothetical protein
MLAVVADDLAVVVFVVLAVLLLMSGFLQLAVSWALTAMMGVCLDYRGRGL